MVRVQKESPALLVGRDAELTRLSTFIDQARSGVASLLVTGEPGMGKSSLLRVCTESASVGGAKVLQATGAEFETDVGFAALHQLLMPHQEPIARLVPRHRDALRICLGLAEGPPPSRSTIASATLALLTQLAASSWVLVAVDDVQWLDRPSATILVAVAAGMSGSGVGLLCTLREGEESFLEPSSMPQLHLGPLPRDAAADLLGRRAPRLDVGSRDRLLSEARGNPLALLELPLGGSTASSDWKHESVLPERLRRLFAPRIMELPTSTQEFLLLAALDTSTELRVILAAGADRISEADVELSAARGLVAVDGHTRTVQFKHPLIRSTVVGVARPGDRRAAHHALGEAQPDQIHRRSWHRAESLVAPDEGVATMLEESAHLLLRRGDPVGAVTTLLRSADLSEEPSQRSRRLALGAYLGAHVTGDLSRVSTLLSGARDGEALRPGSLNTATAAAYALLNGDGDIDTAHRLLVGALSVAYETEDPARDLLVEALCTLLGICFFGGRGELWKEFDVHLDRFRPPVPRSLRLCVQTLGRPSREGAAALTELRSAIGDLASETDLNEVALVGRAAFYVDELEACRPALWRVVNVGTRVGALTPVIDAWMLLGFHAFLDGQWAAASQYLGDGLTLCEQRGYELLAWPGHYGLALIAAATGEDEVSGALSDAMLLWAQPRGVRSVSAYAQHVKALVALGQCDFDTAYRHASSVSEPGVLDPSLAHALWVAMDLVEAAVHSGRYDQAVAHVAAMRASDMGQLSSRCALMLAASEAMISSDDELFLFDRALAIPGADRWPFELARVQLAYGGRLHRARLHTQAREQLSAALDAFLLLRASPWIRRARSEVAASSTQRGPGLHPVAGLTARELEVAGLAASGLSNSQIGGRLDMSTRTVSAHVSHVLAKLGLSSRAGLRDALSSRGC